jgi:hypothetical protein
MQVQQRQRLEHARFADVVPADDQVDPAEIGDGQIVDAAEILDADAFVHGSPPFAVI